VGLPGSWGSRCVHALLSDPGEVVVDWSRATTMLPSTTRQGVDPREKPYIGALSHGLPAPCLRFAAWVAP